jgi:hypothetical protein
VKRYARTCPGQSLEVIPIERPYSFFHLNETRFSGCQPLRWIFSQVRLHHGRTMVIEKLGEPEDLREENGDLRTRNPDFKSSVAYRLSFFAAKFATQQRLARLTDGEFIGYAVVKEDSAPSFGERRRVYESVIRPSRLVNNFVHGGQDWPCQVGGKAFKVNGCLYAQQNTLTNVCAHVALRTAAARFHPNGDMSYREMNQLLGIDHVKVRMGEGNGLTTKQMQQVPKEVKLNPVRAEIIGADYLFTILPQLPPDNNPWAERLAHYANEHKLVLRPYLLDPAEYAAHLEKVKDWQGKPVRETLIRALRANLTKERLWMIELSVPELFSANLRKVGEVLVRAELLPAVDRDLASFVLARLPGYFALLGGGTPADPQYQFIPSGAEGHVELIGCEGDR